VKRCSTSLVIREMQITTTMRCTSHSLGCLETVASVDEEAEKLEPLQVAGKNIRWLAPVILATWEAEMRRIKV
jgi:hypothetical protein